MASLLLPLDEQVVLPGEVDELLLEAGVPEDRAARPGAVRDGVEQRPPPALQRVGDGEDAAPGTPQQLRAAVAAGVESLAAEAPPDGSSGDVAPLLSAALSAALCRLQRAKRLRAQVEPRVLLVSAAADSPAQYLPTMNCIFGAQKLGVGALKKLLGI